MKKIFTLGLLRAFALVLLLAGAGGSLAMVLQAGRNNKSVLLIGLFVIWALSPFVALLMADSIAKRWGVIRRVTLYCLMMVLTLGCLVFYNGALKQTGSNRTGVFLIVPLLSWVLIAIVILVAGSISRRLSPKGDSD